MLDDVLHNQCVQDTDVDQVMAVAEIDQVMAVAEIEMDLPEINTKEEAVHAHHMEDKTGIAKRSGNLTLKDKD